MLRAYLFLAAVVAPALLAQDSVRPHFVRASGEAVISVKPDRAEVTIGVTSSAPSAAAASAHNATESTQVLNSIRQALGSGGEVKTSGYSLSPQYEYSNGHPPRLTGYQASNTVTVTIDQLSLLGKVIDSATQTGATNVNGISFTLKDPSAVRQKVLTEAAKKARANAEALANALGVTVTGLLEAEPAEVPAIRPLARTIPSVAMMAEKVATPVESGDVDVNATVTVTLQVR